MGNDVKKLIPNPNEYIFNWKSRKMWIAIILFVMSSFLFVTPLVQVQYTEWATFIKWIFSIYMITNAIDKGNSETTSNWKSRKIYGLLVILLSTTIFLFINLITFSNWTSMIQWIYGIYSGANVGGKFMKRLNN
jgi:multisubunit Na+/H+ antiporter MnhB subunit